MRHFRGPLFLALFTALALLAAGNGYATEYFASPSGSDSNPGTQAAPFKTLAKGVSVLHAGDKLTLRDGLYTSSSSVNMTTNGTASSPITIRAFLGETPVIRCTTFNAAIQTGASYLIFEDLVFDGNSQGSNGILATILNGRTSDHLRASRCTFKNHRGSGLRLVPADFAVIENCTFTSNGENSHEHGIYAETGDSMIIRNNFFGGNSGYGIHLYSDSSTIPRSASGLLGGAGIIISGNRSTGNGFLVSNGGGIVVGGEFTDVIVENNVSYGNYNEGIVIGYSDIMPLRTIVRNNTFFGNGGSAQAAQVLVEYAGGTVLSNNIVDPGATSGACAEITSAAQGTVFDRNLYSFSNRFRVNGVDVGLASWKSSTGETNALVGTPVFLNGSLGDFHLVAGSPGIDAGSATAGHFAATDFDGETRPQGAGLDIGADEFSNGGGDTTPPTTSITAPSSGSIVSGIITVSANAGDNVGVTRVEFYADGVLIGTDTTSLYSITWNTANVINGAHNLTSKAYDAANNAGASPAVGVTVDNSIGGGTEYFASPSGSDSNPGTFAAPFRTVAKGVSVLGAGDTLTLRGGLYESNQTIFMDVNGTASAPITLRAYPGEVPVIRSTNFDTTLLTGAAYLVFEDLIFDGNYVSLEGIKLHVIGGQRTHHARVSRCTFMHHIGSGMLVNPGDFSIIEDSVFINNGRTYLDHGLYFNNGDGAIIRNNILQGNAGFGIHLFSDTGCYGGSASGLCGGIGNVVTGNVSSGNGWTASNGSGIVVAGDFRGTIVENNMVYGNYNEGIILDYSSLAPQNTIIRNNTFYNNGSLSNGTAQVTIGLAGNSIVSNNIADPGSSGGYCAVITADAQGTVFDRNLYSYNNRFTVNDIDTNLTGWQSATGEANAFLAVPAFVNASAGDFHLTSGTAAIDAGSSVPSHFAATDFDGDSRPQGGGVDIGADEFNTGCAYSISPATQQFAVQGGTGSISMTTMDGCHWMAVSGQNWITLTSGNGVGNGTVNYTVEPNNTPALRTGNISVAGLIFTITQDPGNITFLFFDDFSDGDASDWTFQKGSWSVLNNDLSGTTARKASALSPDFGGCSVCTIQADLQIQTALARISVLGWYRDKANYVEVRLMDDLDEILLMQKANGSTVAKQVATIPIGLAVNYQVQVAFDGNNFEVLFNGTLILTVPAGSLPSGNVALRVKSTSGMPATGVLSNILVY